MSEALALWDGLVAGLRTQLPVEAVYTVEAHKLAVDQATIKAYSRRPNAVFITCESGETVPVGGTLRDKLKFRAYILTRDRAIERRTAACLAIRQQVLRSLFAPGAVSDWYPAGQHGAPTEVQSHNVTTHDLDEDGLALWIVEWTHQLVIPPLVEHDSLPDFRRLWAEIHNPGEVPATSETGTALAEQQIDLEQDDP